MLGNDLVLLLPSMTFLGHIRELMCVIRSFLSANDMCTALSERPLRGKIACVCLANETQETLEVNKVASFSRYHNFKLELNRIRVWRAFNWRAYGVGKIIPYQAIIVKP